MAVGRPGPDRGPDWKRTGLCGEVPGSAEHRLSSGVSAAGDSQGFFQAGGQEGAVSCVRGRVVSVGSLSPVCFPGDCGDWPCAAVPVDSPTGNPGRDAQGFVSLPLPNSEAGAFFPEAFRWVNLGTLGWAASKVRGVPRCPGLPQTSAP